MQLYLNGVESRLSDLMEDDLARAVYNSLFSWARARDDDDLPGDSRYGWWADTYATDQPDDRFGSRLWLLMRAKLTDETVQKAQEYAQEALQWLIDDGVAVSVSATAERVGSDRLDLTIEIVKPNDRVASVARFQDVWRD